MGGVTAEGGAIDIVTENTAEAAPGAAIKVKAGGVMVITVTGDTAAVETGATPDDSKLINVISSLIDIFTICQLSLCDSVAN